MLFLPEPDYVVDIYHPAKLHLDPISGFVSEVSRIKLFTRLFVRLFFVFFKSSTANTPARILTQNTSKDEFTRKDVPFWGSQNQKLSFTPFFAQKSHLRD